MDNITCNNSENHTNRRKFIKQLGYSALGTGLSLNLIHTLGCGKPNNIDEMPSKSPYKTKNHVEGMAYHPFGKTNLMVSRLSLGGDRWDPAVGKEAIRMGVNLVHGSTHYKTMASQVETLGEQWDKFWYVLKHSGKPEDMGKTVDTCLQTIKQDHVEIVAFVIRETNVTDYEQVLSNFEKLKKAGKVQTLGVTVHTRTVPEVCREAIAADIFDMMLTMYQPDKKTEIDKELERAVEKNMGIMSMKTAQGIAKEDTSKAIAAALAGGKVDTVLKRITDLYDLETYLNVARASSSHQADFGQPCKDSSVCGACGNCLVCPQNIDIQEIMRCATYYGSEPGLQDYARQTYQAIPAVATIESCIDCGQCERHCPRNLPIRRTLRTAREEWNVTV